MAQASPREHEQLISDYVSVWNEGDYEKRPDLVSESAIIDDPGAPDGPVHGPDGLESLVRELRTGFPDFHVTIDDVLASDDVVMAEWTATGIHLMTQLTPFVESVEAIRRLDDAVTWLPDDLSIGLHNFRDATVRRPEQDDPMETIDYFVELARDASELRILTHLAPPAPLVRTIRDALGSGQLTATSVVTAGTIAYMRDKPERRDRWRRILRAGVESYCYDGEIPCNLFVFDGKVLVKKSGPGSIQESYGVPIVSDDETVHAWACDLIEAHEADATRVDIECLDWSPNSR